MDKVENDHSESTGSTFLLKQGIPQHMAEDWIWVVLEYP